MAATDAKFFNCSEKHEVDRVCKKYENPQAVRQFIKEKAAEGVIKHWTNEKLYAFLAESGFKSAPKAKKLSLEKLVSQVHAQCGISKSEAHKVIEEFVKYLQQILVADDSITLPTLGTFKMVEHAPRKGRNPHTGEEIAIPARKTVKFAPAKGLREAVAKL